MTPSSIASALVLCIKVQKNIAGKRDPGLIGTLKGEAGLNECLLFTPQIQLLNISHEQLDHLALVWTIR